MWEQIYTLGAHYMCENKFIILVPIIMWKQVYPFGALYNSENLRIPLFGKDRYIYIYIYIYTYIYRFVLAGYRDKFEYATRLVGSNFNSGIRWSVPTKKRLEMAWNACIQWKPVLVPTIQNICSIGGATKIGTTNCRENLIWDQIFNYFRLSLAAKLSPTCRG